MLFRSGDSYSTNLFIWYGEHHLGRINLKRSKGTLVITANPPAGLITIQGPEFSVRLTNSAGLTTNIPTDRYTVEAQYVHWQQTQEATVYSMGAWTCPFAPRLGTVELSCNQSGASFQVADRSGKLVEAGDLPATIPEVPEGNYKLTVWHHRSKVEQTLVVKAGSTNRIEVPFLYGGVRLETDPPGATVVTAGGENLGVTPLLLSELVAGRLRIEMRLAGYSSATADLLITALQTNTFQTNLVSVNYARAIAAARQYLSAGDYDRALSAASEALQAKAGDADAIALQKEALGKGHLRRAEALGKQGDYIAADKELEAALQSLPDNEEAKQLLAAFKVREAEQIERLRVERAERPKKVFDGIVSRTTDANLFDNHELESSKGVTAIEAGIVSALQEVHPAFKIVGHRSSQPETFEIECSQEISGGLRRGVVVGGQTRDDETQILFKVLEFKTHHSVSLQGLLNFTDNISYIPVHPSRIPEFTDKLKAQVEDGVKIVTDRIQQAITQSLPRKD